MPFDLPSSNLLCSAWIPLPEKISSPSSTYLKVQLQPTVDSENPGHFLQQQFSFARSCLGKVPGGAPFSQRSERVTACTIRMQIDKQIDVQDELR